METKERHSLFAGVEELIAAAQMTAKDLAVWLDRPYMTLKEWLDKGVQPSECYHLDIERRLDLLRESVKNCPASQPLLPNRRSRSAAGRAHEILALYAKATGAEPPVLKEEVIECRTKKPTKSTKKPTTKKPKAPSKSASRPSKRGQARSNASPVT